MPRYQITAPDGRIVTIEGDRAPTQEDASKIFSSLPPKIEATAQAPASAVEAEQPGMLRKIGDALTAGIPKGPDIRAPSPSGATSAMTEMGMGGLTFPDAELATNKVASTAVRLAAPVGGFVAGGPVGAGLGGLGGEYLAQKIEGDEIRPGAILASGAVSAIPGAPLASSGIRALLREGVKQGTAGVLAKNAESLIDEGRLASTRENVISSVIPAAGGALAQRIQAANPEIRAAVAAAEVGPGATKRATLAAGKEAGYLVVPSDVNQSFINKRIESLAGPADVRRGVALANQQTTNAISAADLGLPAGTEITRPVLRGVRAEASAPYTELEALSPAIAADVQSLRDARSAAHINFEHYKRSASPESLRVAQEAQSLANGLETSLEGAATSVGRPELVDAMRAARTRIAKSYDYERALNVGDSGISAPVMGRAIDRGRPLSGGAETIANFAEAFPRAVPEGAMVHPFGLSKTEAITGGALGSGLFATTHNPLLAAVGAIAPPLISAGSRRLVLSAPYQRLMTDLPPPRVDANPDDVAAAIRLLTQAGALQQPKDEPPAEEKKPEKEPPRKSAKRKFKVTSVDQ